MANSDCFVYYSALVPCGRDRKITFLQALGTPHFWPLVSGASIRMMPIEAGLKLSCHNKMRLSQFYIRFDLGGVPPIGFSKIGAAEGRGVYRTGMVAGFKN